MSHTFICPLLELQSAFGWDNTCERDISRMRNLLIWISNQTTQISFEQTNLILDSLTMYRQIANRLINKWLKNDSLEHNPQKKKRCKSYMPGPTKQIVLNGVSPKFGLAQFIIMYD